MRKVSRTVGIVLLLAAMADVVTASDLLVKTDHHYVSRPSDKTPMSVIFTDERVVASVKLDVYTVPQLPSTKRYYEDLQKLTAESWLLALRWSLTDSDGRELPLQRPETLRASVRRRGPNAEEPRDRDVTVDCTTYEATFDLGLLAPGEYTLAVAVSGLRSSFGISIRTGQEPDVRDKFLEVQAGRASTYADFRRIQLERHRRDASKLDPVFTVIDRALLESTLDDTRELLRLALAAMSQRREQAKDPAKIQFFDRRISELRETERALPEYFRRRADWLMVRDRGAYVIKERKSGAVVKAFGSNQEQ